MKIPLDKIECSLNEHYDVFVASASYELRSIKIINAIADKITFDDKFVMVSIPHKGYIKDNLKIFKNEGFTFIEIDNSKQVDTYTGFFEQINAVMVANPNASFLIDITTFTKQTLLILLRFLRNTLTHNNSILFLYTDAEEYSVGLRYEKKWLSRGLLQVNSVFGYSGVIRPSRPYHLIILMGYEVERASSLILAYEPEKITVGYARESASISEKHYELNKRKFDDLLAECPHVESFEFSCVDITDCKKDILDQAKKHRGYNVIVSPMNNKISTLSTALAAFENHEIQLAIAIPAIYNYENYSTPSDYFRIIEMPDIVK